MTSFLLRAFRNIYYGRQEATPIPSFCDPTVAQKRKPTSSVKLSHFEPTGIWADETDDIPDLPPHWYIDASTVPDGDASTVSGSTSAVPGP